MHGETQQNETPNLERALGRLRSRLVVLVFVHGIGTMLSVTAAWLVFAFLADWGLHVPAPVRVLHAAVFFGLPVFFGWRELARPLSRLPGRSGLAVLLERVDPSLSELLVSATQLQASPDAGSSELVAEVCREADERVRDLDYRRVLDRRNPAARLMAGLSCVGVTAALFVVSPTHARIFFERMLGSDVPWPRRTHLVVEIPSVTDVRLEGNVIEASVARGSDVPVLITARGVAPEEVTLHFSDGAKEVLARGSGQSYRRVLRSLQQNLEFYVTGGDDDDRDPRVRLSVLQPPDVTGIAVRIDPPEYTGLPGSVVFNRDAEVLAGSRLSVHVLVDPPSARGIARVLPEDLELALSPTPFPQDPTTVDPENPDGLEAPPLPGLGFELEADRSLRYRFELTDDQGLENPDPGLFAIHVLEDRTPDVQLLSPGRSDIETIAGGAIPLRVRVKDDFGLRGLTWRSTDSQEEQELATAPLAWRSLLGEGSGSPDAGEGRQALASRRLSVTDLFGSEVTEGARLTLEVVATDNRAPVANEGHSSPVRVRIVSADELVRRIQDRLARLRLEVTSLSELQTEKWRRVDELLDAFGSDDLVEAGDSRALSNVLNGQRRVRGDSASVARELAAIASTVIYAGLDEKAGPLLERLDARMANVSDRTFQPEVWQALHAEYRDGTLGSAGLAGNLVEILGVALAVSETHARLAEEALTRAQNAVDISGVRDSLEEAAHEQTEAMARIEDLLERLAEWDSFQSVLSLARDILNRQSVLRQRTQRFASEK